MKMAVWLYFFIFIAFFDLHAQYPILSPFALSLGATPSFIGLLLGVYSITHLPGNLLAGYGIDRYGSKFFIAFSLIAAGILLIIQSHVVEPWQLLAVRSISGFVLAFLSPACLALLAKLAKDSIQQGKFMAGNGFVHTIASVVSPAAGAFLVAKLGFGHSFSILGWGLLATGILAFFRLQEPGPMPAAQQNQTMAHPETNAQSNTAIPLMFFAIPLTISSSQGILFFELPLMQSANIVTSGILFSLISFGSLVTLSMLFLNRTSPLLRTLSGSMALAFIFFGLAVQWPISLQVMLIMIGMTKGIIYPAIATFIASVTSRERYGRVFSMLSIAYATGSFIGPVLAGQLRDHVSSYYIAFVLLMLGLSLVPINHFRRLQAAQA